VWYNTIIRQMRHRSNKKQEQREMKEDEYK